MVSFLLMRDRGERFTEDEILHIHDQFQKRLPEYKVEKFKNWDYWHFKLRDHCTAPSKIVVEDLGLVVVPDIEFKAI